MIAHGTKIKIFAGNSHPELAQAIASQLVSKSVTLLSSSSLTERSPYPSMRPSAAATFLSYSPPAALSTIT